MRNRRPSLRDCFLHGADLPEAVVAPVMSALAGKRPAIADDEREALVRRVLFAPTIALSKTLELLARLPRLSTERLMRIDTVLRSELNQYAGIWNSDPAINDMIARAIYAGKDDTRALAWVTARGILKAFRVAAHFDETLAYADREAALLWHMAASKSAADGRLSAAIRVDFWRHPGIRYVYGGAFAGEGLPSRLPRRPRVVSQFDFDKVPT